MPADVYVAVVRLKNPRFYKSVQQIFDFGSTNAAFPHQHEITYAIVDSFDITVAILTGVPAVFMVTHDTLACVRVLKFAVIWHEFPALY